ncbi:hypothetical protein B0H13DRAFT_2452374 [Mycena leptocephala]|nr:hypothetical protein B0H13DRAFT_2452374 [Mycena leptocephala]
MRCVSSAPFLPGPQPLALHLSFLCCSCPFIPSVPQRIGCTTHRIPIWARKRSYSMSTYGVRQLRGTRLRVGMLRARWCAGLVPGQPVHKETCPVHLSIFVFTRDPSISMAFIGPNFFYVRSIFTSFSARHSGWASSREFFSFHLISLASNAQLLPLLPSSRSSWSISIAFLFHYRLATIFDSARGGDMHPRAVRNGVAREREEGRGGARGGSWVPALLVYLFTVSWSSRIRVSPQRLVCLSSPCAPAPALGRYGAAHPDPAAARSAYALVSSSRLVFAQSNLSCDLPFSFSPFRVSYTAYAGICSSPPAGVPRPAAHLRVSCALGEVVLGIVGDHRAALGFGLHSSEQIFLYFVQFYIAFPSFILYSIPVLSLFLHSSLLPPRPPSSISARVEAGADSHFVIALRVTPVPCTRPRLPWGRTRHVAAYLQYLDIAAARHVVYPRGALLGLNDEQGERALWDESSHHHDCPPATRARAQLPGPLASLDRYSLRRALPIVLRRPSTRVQYRHTAPHCQVMHPRMRATSGVNEGAERAHPRDWPARRDYEVGDRARWGGVFALALALGSLRRLCSRSASYDRIMMTGIGIGIGIADTVSMCRGATVTVTARPLRCLCHGHVGELMEQTTGMLGYGLEGMDRGGWMERRSKSGGDQAAAGRVRREGGGEGVVDGARAWKRWERARAAPLQHAAGTILKCFLVAHLNACVLGGSSSSLCVLESGATSPLCSTVMYAVHEACEGVSSGAEMVWYQGHERPGLDRAVLEIPVFPCSPSVRVTPGFDYLNLQNLKVEADNSRVVQPSYVDTFPLGFRHESGNCYGRALWRRYAIRRGCGDDASCASSGGTLIVAPSGGLWMEHWKRGGGRARALLVPLPVHRAVPTCHEEERESRGGVSTVPRHRARVPRRASEVGRGCSCMTSGETTGMVVLIPTTSAQKKAVTKRKEGVSRVRFPGIWISVDKYRKYWRPAESNG